MNRINKTDELRDIVDYLCKKLLENGFTIQRYDAHSTNSVYLKLDYGVCNSIRISDHPGKKYLKYRYNIGPYVKNFHKVQDKYIRYYYRQDKAKNLIKKILEDRKQKQEQYGKDNYQRFMEKNRLNNFRNAGFWRNVYLVKEASNE